MGGVGACSWQSRLVMVVGDDLPLEVDESNIQVILTLSNNRLPAKENWKTGWECVCTVAKENKFALSFGRLWLTHRLLRIRNHNLVAELILGSQVNYRIGTSIENETTGSMDQPKIGLEKLTVRYDFWWMTSFTGLYFYKEVPSVVPAGQSRDLKFTEQRPAAKE